VAQTTFYDAYDLGLAHERAGRWSAARTAFEAAVDLRPNAGRNVPTFGRDVLAVYDPYFHLAAVEIELGLVVEAREHLATAKSAGVSPPEEMEALAARLGEPSPPEPDPTSEPLPPNPTPAPEVRAGAAPIAVPPMAEQAPSETPAPSPVVFAEESETTEETPRQRVGGVFLLAAILAAAAVIFFYRRRRITPQVGSKPDFDTTPTRRVETAPGAPSSVSPDAPSAVNTTSSDTQVGNYRLLEVLGRGGMATTYRAERQGDGRIVALKVPHEHLLDDPEFVERFLREGSLGATIHHPNIIRIYEAGCHRKTPFIAMELIDGITLEARMKEDGALPVPEALEIARGIALALDYAHVKGVVHRDVKPDNVMLLADGTVKVMDFGIARVAATPGLTATNTYLGTPLYSSPEAIDPDEVGPESDLYSLGIVLYRMLSNQVPFEAPSPFKLVELHRTEPLPRFARELGIPAQVESMVRCLSAKRKHDRFPSAEAFLHDLNQYMAGNI
jgi:hypothetical protein